MRAHQIWLQIDLSEESRLNHLIFLVEVQTLGMISLDLRLGSLRLMELL